MSNHHHIELFDFFQSEFVRALQEFKTNNDSTSRNLAQFMNFTSKNFPILNAFNLKSTELNSTTLQGHYQDKPTNPSFSVSITIILDFTTQQFKITWNETLHTNTDKIVKF